MIEAVMRLWTFWFSIAHLSAIAFHSVSHLDLDIFLDFANTQEHVLGQPRWDQVCQGDDADTEHDRSASRNGQELVRGGKERDGIDGAGAHHLHRHHDHVGVPQGRSHVGVHGAAGGGADAGAAG